MLGNETLQLIHEGEIAVVLSVGGWMLLFPIRSLIDKVKKEWEGMIGRLDTVQKELSEQRTNCLQTLQIQGGKQIELLDKAATTLDAMHLSQVEMTGYIKARNEHQN